MTQLAASAASTRAALPLARAFYVGQAALMAIIVLAGFWPFYAELPRAVGSRPPLVYLHGAIFTGWLGLFAVQTMLIYNRNVRLHRRLGMFGAAYGVLLIAFGLIVGFVASAEHVRVGEWSLDYAAGFMILPIFDMVLFAGFFGAAVYYRKQKETHKRLMLLACNALVFAGAARFAEPNLPLILFIWYLPVVLGMAFDRLTMGRVHRVYTIGSAVMLVFFLRALLMESELWLPIGRAMLNAYMN